MFKITKKILQITTLFILVIQSLHFANAEDYHLEGFLDEYSFEITYPTTWKAKISGDDFQGVSPKAIKDILLFEIREFKGKTYHEAIEFYTNDKTEIKEGKTKVLHTKNGNILAREVIFQDSDNANRIYTLTFVKRGLSIFVLTNPNLEGTLNYPYIESVSKVIKEILDSFVFNDQYEEYIDYKSGYAFIYPKKFKSIILNDKVLITNSKNFSFIVQKYTNKSIEDLFISDELNKYIKSSDLKLENGYRATMATFKNMKDSKKFNKYYIQRGADIYELTAENSEVDYPNNDYYTADLKDIIASFEFFTVSDLGDSAFLDIQQNHVNIDAITHLKENGVIQGFPNGAFYPDFTINRAELVKMVVASKIQPDLTQYNNCFPDVVSEWFGPYICYAKEKGWVSGYEDGFFRPEANVSRYEAIKIILESLSGFSNENEQVDEMLVEKNEDEASVDIEEVIEQDKWFDEYFEYAEENDFLDKVHEKDIDGKLDYLGESEITRKEVAEMIFRVLGEK